MSNRFTKLVALLMALVMVLGMVPAVAEEAAAAEAATAYIMYANADWSAQYWYDGNEYAGVTPTTVDVTAEGDYTVGLTFENPSNGLAFMALGLKNGEKLFPKHYLKINAIRVNGAEIAFDKGYTSSDDQIETRMNIYNEWVSELPADARSFDGNVEDANWIIVDKAAFEGVTAVEIDFTLMKNGIDTAYIMFADGTWERQYWLDGNDYGGVTVKNATITGAGDYSVGLDFTTTEYGKAVGIAFAALGIKKGENTFPGMMIKINDFRINGESVEVAKGYTSSDDQIETRMNIYNEWVAEVPTDATVRSWDGTTEGAAPIIVAKEAFAEVKTIDIDFSLIPVTDTAYIMFADSAWAVQYWLDGNEYAGVTANNATVEGPGTYTAGLTFETPATGVAFAALGIKTGEKTFPGHLINIKEVKINGEAVEVAKGYTSSDDQIETRMNLYNEWVTELPTDLSVRSWDGTTEGAAPIIIAKEAFAEVKSIEITFDYIYGEPAVAEGPVPMTEDEIAAAKAADYNAYFGFQTENYIFRNAWDDASYGKDIEGGLYFGQMTGWDADNNAVNYGGTYTDAAVTANGTYSVSLTCGDMAYGPDTFFRMLYVSTDIPSAAVEQGVVTISDITVKFGEGKTQSASYVNTSGDYAKISLIDEYDSKAPADLAYTMPAAGETITISFTVSGLAD
ncbi:MAG: hypothetical protein E7320_11595 [Clostridiales bacterium]|nr:hypothetical protein [Clostridiales bacterium]